MAFLSLQKPKTESPNSLAKSTDNEEGADTAKSTGILAIKVFVTIS